MNKKLIYLLAGIQLKTKVRITIKDLETIGLTIGNIKRHCQLIKEHSTHYHFYVNNDKIIIGLTLIIHK